MVEPYSGYLEAELGVRNHWYAVFFGEELEEGKCLGEMVMGERILFKRVEGKVYAIEDRCPHRGAAFSARPECYTKNTVTCWFHGFTFDVRDGSLVQIITDPGNKLIGRLKQPTYPVEEVNGVVFVFVGDMDPPPPLVEDLQPKFLTPKLVVHPVSRNKVKGNWRLSCENGFDAGHIYGHRNAGMFTEYDVAVPLSTYPSSPEHIVVNDDDKGPWGVTKANDDVNIWSVEIEGEKVTAANVDLDELPPNTDIVVGLFMPCGLEVDWWPVPGVLHFEWYTPIDEDHHSYMICHAKVVNSPEEEAEFRQLCKDALIPMTWQRRSDQEDPEGDGVKWGFNNFDSFGREQTHHVYQYEDYWHKERLIRPDMIISKWRQLVDKRLRGIQKRDGWAPSDDWSPDGRDYDAKKVW